VHTSGAYQVNAGMDDMNLQHQYNTTIQLVVNSKYVVCHRCKSFFSESARGIIIPKTAVMFSLYFHILSVWWSLHSRVYQNIVPHWNWYLTCTVTVLVVKIVTEKNWPSVMLCQSNTKYSSYTNWGHGKVLELKPPQCRRLDS